MEESKRGWRLGRRAGVLALAVCIGAVLPIAGCSRKAASPSGAKTVEKDYTRGQIRIIAATERNRYQNIYTSKLWNVKADDSGETFEEKLIGQIEQFLVEVATANLMADEQDVELTGQEKDALNSLAKEYYNSLSQQDKNYTGVSESEIYDLYCEFYRADKLVGELTKNENLEVSDAESKVIHVQQIELDTRERAEDVLSQVRQEKADFLTIASKSSRDARIAYTMEWSGRPDARVKAAFALEQDEISPIVEEDGKFYIFKCTNAYDKEATAARKNMLAQEKKTQAFLSVYEPFAREHPVKLKENLGEMVDFTSGQDCTTDDFFQLYHSHFDK